MIEVILYSRIDCHLCEQAKLELESLQEDIPHRLTVIDVDSDPKLRKLYGFNVPVIVAGPYHLNAPITRQDLIITLRATVQREHEIVQVTESIERKKRLVKVSWTKSDQFSEWLSKHYLALFNIIIGLYLSVAFLAPLLMKAGAVLPASWIYRVYGAMCHELAFRSWFLFGEQLSYPREAAGVNVALSYTEATGLDESDLWAARDFVGNEIIGFKVALCQRDVAIYAGILVFGLIFSIVKRRIKPLHWVWWIMVGMVPIGLDGISQLITQLPFFAEFPLRESTPFLRTLTGSLFGITTAWFGYPLVEETMRDTRKYLASKRERIRVEYGEE